MTDRDTTLEDAAIAIRAACQMCDNGILLGEDRPTECEYCGRPMAAVRALKSSNAASVEEPNDFITIYEHCVRKLRRMLVTGESSADINATVSRMERVLGIDVAKAQQESLDPGSIEGYPFTAAEEAKAKAAGLIP